MSKKTCMNAHVKRDPYHYMHSYRSLLACGVKSRNISIEVLMRRAVYSYGSLLTCSFTQVSFDMCCVLLLCTHSSSQNINIVLLSNTSHSGVITLQVHISVLKSGSQILSSVRILLLELKQLDKRNTQTIKTHTQKKHTDNKNTQTIQTYRQSKHTDKRNN